MPLLACNVNNLEIDLHFFNSVSFREGSFTADDDYFKYPPDEKEISISYSCGLNSASTNTDILVRSTLNTEIQNVPQGFVTVKMQNFIEWVTKLKVPSPYQSKDSSMRVLCE